MGHFIQATRYNGQQSRHIWQDVKRYWQALRAALAALYASYSHIGNAEPQRIRACARGAAKLSTIVDKSSYSHLSTVSTNLSTIVDNLWISRSRAPVLPIVQSRAAPRGALRRAEFSYSRRWQAERSFPIVHLGFPIVRIPQGGIPCATGCPLHKAALVSNSKH